MKWDEQKNEDKFRVYISKTQRLAFAFSKASLFFVLTTIYLES